jgi:hypothetical protein
MRVQLYALERTARNLRANLEDCMIRHHVDGMQAYSPIPTSLQALLESNVDIPLQTLEPYYPFHKGVWGSFGEGKDCMKMLVAAKKLRALSPASTHLQPPEISRLTVHPVFDQARQPGWCSLETEVEVEAFRAAQKIEISLISFFDVPEQETAALPASCSMNLRFISKDHSSRDGLTRHFMVTAMPFEQSIVFEKSHLDSIDLSDVTLIVLILLLPTSGKYSFHLDHFSMKALD